MITFGLTGGICCGKSTVSLTFKKNNIPIVDADVIAREVIAPGSTGQFLIASSFGESYFYDDGTLNRSKLAELVFNDRASMSTLNNIMASLIQNEADKQINALHAKGHGIVGYDAALIIEQGNQNKYRPLIVVSCPKEIQLARLMSRNSLTKQQAMARIESQFSLEKKIKFADYVIDTSKSITGSISQTESVINSIIDSFYYEGL
jgi:dephospho-CoA kinase